MRDSYQVQKFSSPPTIHVTVPGSKSITNRALCLAAVCKGKTVLKGALFSQDSRVFIDALRTLGFQVDCYEERCEITIEGELAPEADVYVGSAGTTARFLTAVLALSGGHYHVTSSEQMKKRPMKPLLQALEYLGADIHYVEEEYRFPLEICGFHDSGLDKIELNIDESSQFLSALLLAGVLLKRNLTVELSGERTARSYVVITEKMITQFGGKVEILSHNQYQLIYQGEYVGHEYDIEPDVSAACYFYGMAALTGGTALVQGVHLDSTQGDLKFIKLLEKMGCRLEDTKEGIYLQGKESEHLSGVEIDMSDYSDQTMTLAAMAPFLTGPTHIYHIEHIRHQESDRIHGIATELKRLGIRCEEEEGDIWIYPGKVQPARIETYEDHRMAMAFSLVGCMVDGIVIDNPGCCAKTFEKYFEVLDSIVDKSRFNL